MDGHPTPPTATRPGGGGDGGGSRLSETRSPLVPPVSPPTGPVWLLPLLAFIVYLCHPLTWNPAAALPIWSPPAGLGLVLVAWFGWRFASDALLGAGLLLLLHHSIGASRAGTLHAAAPFLLWILAEAWLSAAESTLAWWAYHHRGRGHRQLSDPRSAMQFVLLVPGACAGVSAALRVVLSLFILAGAPGVALPTWSAALPLFWLDRSLGLLVLAPPLLVFFTPWLKRLGVLPPPLYHDLPSGFPASLIAPRSAAGPGEGHPPVPASLGPEEDTPLPATGHLPGLSAQPPAEALPSASTAGSSGELPAGGSASPSPESATGYLQGRFGYGDGVEMIGLAAGAAVLCWLSSEAVWAERLGRLKNGPQLWGLLSLLIVWASLRQGLRGGILATSAAATAPLVARQFLPPSGEEPLPQPLFQAHLVAQCSAGLLVAAGMSWTRLRETGYQQVVSHVPVVIYSARLLEPGQTRPKRGHVGGQLGYGIAEVSLVSAASVRLLGYPAEFLLGDYGRWLNLVHPDDREVVLAALDQLSRQDQPVTCEYRLAEAPHAVRWLRDTLAPHRDAGCRLVGWEGVVTDVTEQRNLADDLRRTTSMFHALVANLPAGVFFIQGTAGQPVLVNARARQLLGQREDSGAGLEHLSRVYRLYRPDGSLFPAEELPVYQALRYGRTTMRDDIVVHRPDGRRLPLVTWGAPVYLNPPAAPDAAVWVLEDLTSLHQAEAARKDTEGRLRTVIETMAEGLVVQDSRGQIVSSNSAASAFFGLPPERFHGLSLFDLGWTFLREDGSPLPREEHPAQVALKSGRPVRHLVVGVTPSRPKTEPHTPQPSSGPVRWLLINAMPLGAGGHSQGGSATAATAAAAAGVVMTFSDISAYAQARESIRGSEERYRGLVESLPLVVVLTDLNMRVVYTNPAHPQVTGYTMEEVADPAVWTANVHPDDLPKTLSLLRQAQQGQVVRGELRYQARDGSEKVALLINQPRVVDGEIVGVVSLLLDLTRERRLERELHRAQRLQLVGKLSSGVAHDFNNLLNVVLSLTDLARQHLPDDHPVHEDLQRITAASEQAAALAAQLLALSRQKPIAPRRINLAQIVARTLELLRPTLPMNVTIESNVSHGSRELPILGDESQLQQVMMNLCLNARDAMPDGGLLEVTAGVREDASTGPARRLVSLRVRDTGLGMTEEVRARIFEPFFSTKESGTGLGLAVVQQIVESYGGNVTVTSLPGAGSCFEVDWPMA